MALGDRGASGARSRELMERSSARAHSQLPAFSQALMAEFKVILGTGRARGDDPYEISSPAQNEEWNDNDTPSLVSFEGTPRFIPSFLPEHQQFWIWSQVWGIEPLIHGKPPTNLQTTN